MSICVGFDLSIIKSIRGSNFITRIFYVSKNNLNDFVANFRYSQKTLPHQQNLVPSEESNNGRSM